MLKDLIREQRKKLGYSQAHLALRACTAQSKISDWENGIIPSTHNLVKLCIALDITMEDVENELRKG